MDELRPENLRALFAPLIAAELGELAGLREKSKAERAPLELDQQSVGRVSRIDALQVQAMSQAAEARRQQRTRLLEAARDRLQGDEFGFCIDCGNFIGLSRLRIDPAAIRCRECAR